MDQLFLVGDMPVETGWTGTERFGHSPHAQPIQPVVVEDIHRRVHDCLPAQSCTRFASFGNLPPRGLGEGFLDARLHAIILP